MKGFTFYLEYLSSKERRKATRKELGNHSGNCLAVYGNSFIPGDHYVKKECVSSVFDTANSDVCTSSCQLDWLRSNCLRISEQQARKIHPKLFQYLDCD